MAASHHSRSHSMPSELHPVVVRIEEELNKLKPPTSSSTCQTVCTTLAGLQRLHSCVEDLLRLPLAQQAFAHHRHEKWVAEELDASIRLLDLSGTARDLLSNMKDQVRDLESVLRRRGYHGIRKSVDAYLQSRRKAQSDVNKCLAALKGIEPKSGSAPLDERITELSGLVRLLSQVRAATVSTTSSVLSLVTLPRSSKWSLVSRALRKGKPADVHEAGSTEAALLSIKQDSGDGENVTRVQKQLETMEVGIEGVITGLECLFRQLIQNRVSLLNALSP